MRVRKGDTVLVLAGKDKGKTGKVLRTYRAEDLVLIEGVNIVTKHVKPSGDDKEGGIVKIEKPIHASNVMYFDEKAGVPVKVGYKVENGKKIRVSKKSGKALE